MKNDALYRPGVGILLLNKQRHIFLGERLDHSGAWQMPQGGIDEGENPETAVFREMEEEIGTSNARILRSMQQWLYYDLPVKTAQKSWAGKFTGQRQKWIALQFMGQDTEINLSRHSHPEFGQWKWAPPQDLLIHAVSFKRDVYMAVMQEFSDLF